MKTLPRFRSPSEHSEIGKPGKFPSSRNILYALVGRFTNLIDLIIALLVCALRMAKSAPIQHTIPPISKV